MSLPYDIYHVSRLHIKCVHAVKHKYQPVSTFDVWPWCCKNQTYLHASIAMHGYLRRECYAILLTDQYTYLYKNSSFSVQGTGTSRSGPGLIISMILYLSIALIC